MPEELPRPTPYAIYERAAQAGHEELTRPLLQLAFSGLTGGIVMGLSGLGVALVRAALGEGEGVRLASFALYPLGFIATILGRAQLFTENTLFPVLLVLRERAHLVRTLRLWAVVLASNVLGALVFALLVSRTEALQGAVRDALGAMGEEAVERGGAELFWGAVLGGWLIALVAWLVTASHSTVAQLAFIWLFTFLVGAGHFAHSVAGSGEVMVAVLEAHVPVPGYLRWLAWAVLGNVVGGVGLVSLLNYGQVESAARGAGEPMEPPEA